MTETPTNTASRALTAEDVALMNEGRQLAEQVRLYCNKLAARTGARTGGNSDINDPHWLAVARTHMKNGFAAVISGIAWPAP